MYAYKLFLGCLILVFLCFCEGKNTTSHTKKTKTLSKTTIDSSYFAFLEQFQSARLPYQEDSITLPDMQKKSFLEDYFLRKFLYKDTISGLHDYLTEYKQSRQDAKPWHFAWVGKQFTVGKQITAVIYYTYNQFSASNGGLYQTMLATFDKAGHLRDYAEIGVQSIYQSTIEEKQVYATVKTSFKITETFKVDIKKTETEEVNQQKPEINHINKIFYILPTGDITSEKL
jgi:hypothetical protein